MLLSKQILSILKITSQNAKKCFAILKKFIIVIRIHRIKYYDDWAIRTGFVGVSYFCLPLPPQHETFLQKNFPPKIKRCSAKQLLSTCGQVLK